MFIYILNLLNDGLKNKNNTYERSACEIINDTKYISELAGIRKNLDLKNINDKLMNIFQLFYKYNLTAMDSMEILNKLINNNRNSWLLEYLYNCDINNGKDAIKLPLNSIMRNVLEKDKRNRRGATNELLQEISVAGYEITSEVRITQNRYHESFVS